MQRIRSFLRRLDGSRWRALVGSVVTLTLLAAGTTAYAQSYQEAPTLTERVSAGDLPPVAERLPATPMTVAPHERVGDYGGTWRTALVGGGDDPWLRRTIFYENLVRWNADWTDVVPNVAESVDISEDAREYTFGLREGMRWSDGAPYTADDIMFWFEDIHMNRELNPSEPLNPLTVEKIDDVTVKFTFEQPEGLFLQRIAGPDGWIYGGYPRHYLEQFHSEYNPDGIEALVQAEGVADWVTLFQNKAELPSFWSNIERPTLYPWTVTAPYDGTTTRVVAERNPYYWKVDPEGNQLPYLDLIHFDIFEDVEVLLLRTLNGEIDMISRHINSLTNRAILYDGQEAGGYRLFNAVPSNMNTAVISLNLTHKDPVKREIFQNKDFRIGLSHAINRQEIIDLVYVSQGKPRQPAPRPEAPIQNEQLATQYLEYDPELANEHLDRAGYSERDAQGFRLGPDGERISFTMEVVSSFRPEWVDVLEIVQRDWREVGVDLQVRPMERSLFYTRKEANEHDANVWAGDGGMTDAYLEPRWYFPSNSESNYAPAWAKWFNPTANPGTAPEEPPAAAQRQMELYRQLEASPPDQHEALMNEILEIAAQEFYAIGVSLPIPSYGIVKTNFLNVPSSMPDAWIYPNPAPTNPEQYFLEGGG